jgi:hypothetical protein
VIAEEQERELARDVAALRQQVAELQDRLDQERGTKQRL